ncbi:hypothetical protein BDZ97DRAFT_2071093 [Flammula alnicola]|nr:hypothetical protein BDZ97DRAFT_2071093 [Flammula alnicola]
MSKAIFVFIGILLLSVAARPVAEAAPDTGTSNIPGRAAWLRSLLLDGEANAN